AVYPCLAKMVLDYLSVPATSINVERLFSHGWLLLSHVCSRLSPQSICALLCLGAWSKLGLVKDNNVLKVTAMLDVPGDTEMVLEDGWDTI
ncbi:hypothetical protein SCLCIDRAFT_42331, partial [Scleroderma citrinum Foug A]